MSRDWPFDDPENVMAFTLKRITRGESPILKVRHDEEDGGWQFLDGDDFVLEEASLVCLRTITEIDPSVLELADLPLGWVAERASIDAPWCRTHDCTEEERVRKAASDIDEFGWHVVLIPEDDEGPAFAYSIGLFKSFRHPEIILFGLDHGVMHQMINLIGEEVRSGRRFLEGESSSGFLEAYDVRFVEVSQRHFPEYLGFGCRFYHDAAFPVLQCLWPDRQGRFPTDADFPESLGRRQPLLAP